MSIVSVKQVERFTPYALRNEDGTPQKGAPVYLIAPSSIITRARWRRDVADLGAVLPGPDELTDTLRRGVREIVAEEQHGLLFGLIDEWTDARFAVQRLREQGGGTPEEMQAAGDRLVELSGRMQLFEGQMRARYPLYAQKMGQQQFWYEVAPPMAARHFLCGWENVDVPFAQENDAVPEALLIEAMPEDHIYDVGWRAIGMGRVTAEQRKNSAGASASGVNRSRSRPARKARGSA